MEFHASASRFILACAIAGALAGCTGGYVVDDRGVSVYPDPVIVEPGVVVREPVPRRSYGYAEPRGYDIPPGHYPPPGECRVWFPDRPPGQQPPPGSCNVRVPRGAILIEG